MVDLIIAVHDPTRPLQRALESALESGLAVPSQLRITVVCHNIDSVKITSTLDPSLAADVRFLEFIDAQPSPAGPFMHGIKEASATFVSIMGSDDWLEPGALAAWLARAERMNLTVLIPPERHASGVKVTTPPTRLWRRGYLDGVKDRLAYRTAPLGLIRRESVQRLGLSMSPRLRSGEDLLFGAKLWFSAERLAYGRGDPRYVVGAGAATRVTTTARSADDELRAIAEFVRDTWFVALSTTARRSIIAKLTRVHVFSAASSRSANNSWSDADRGFISSLIKEFTVAAPGFDRVLSIADHHLLDALVSADISGDKIWALTRARRRFGHPETVITRDPRGMLAVDGPLRLMIASRLL